MKTNELERIEENNKLIALFIGLIFSPADKRFDDWYDTDGNRVSFGTRIPLQFHSSWDCLMPVIAKLNKLTKGRDIRPMFDTLMLFVEVNEINNAYITVVKIIQYLNTLEK